MAGGMIENFGNKVARDIWEKDRSPKFPSQFHERAKALLVIMYNLSDLSELKAQGELPALRIHKLKGDRQGDLAVDIDKTSGWRVTFRFAGGKFLDVKIENYH